MKSIFDNSTRASLIERINTLNESSTAKWGKMNIYQMLKHCTVYEEMMLGRNRYKRAFLGRLFGKIALKEFTQDESPIKKNVPTLSELKVKVTHGEVANERKKWISLLEEYPDAPCTDIVHSFFGKLTREQIGTLVYKHTDHHLRQFNS
ncbi:DinB family protein [Flavobacterium sp. LS1R49]|uniref:DinB family protein n=1 Tax=Flavobacterium shii TaxID=2987687 RepID=A0A9X3C5L4_9FLAO|nr:DinB family protein [Flavobacterium shii]MCV9927522.1 DinB family protein [Flavobacterium shii]